MRSAASHDDKALGLYDTPLPSSPLPVELPGHPLRTRHHRQAGSVARVLDECRLRDWIAGFVGHEAHHAKLEVRAKQQIVRIGHPDAIFESEVDVLDLRRDEGEVPRSLPDRDLVSDEAPAGSYALDGVRNRSPDDGAQRVRGRLDTRWIAVEKQLGRDRFHAQMMIDGTRAVCARTAGRYASLRTDRNGSR